MLVWGGRGRDPEPLTDGAQYDPTTDTWPRMSEVGAPQDLQLHVGFWTGASMIVWGTGPIYQSHVSIGSGGGRYTPLSVFRVP